MRLKVIIILFGVLVTGLHGSAPSAPYSYVPSRMFAAYQFYINPSTGNNLTANSNANPYLLTLMDVHNEIQTSAITWGGLSMLATSGNDCGFAIQIVGNLSTQFAFAVSIYGSSQFTAIQFFLILIGTEGIKTIEAISFYQTANLTSTVAACGTPNVSSTITLITNVTTAYTYRFFLSYFNLTMVVSGSTTYALKINDQGSTGQNIAFDYQSDCGNYLNAFAMVVLVFTSNPMPINTSTYGFGFNTYSSDLTSANTANSFAYQTGFDRKCLVGLSTISFLNNFDLSYDMNKLVSNLSSTPGFGMLVFCMVQLYNCSLIDPNCQSCISHSLCESCTSEYYIQTYTNVSSACLPCSSAIAGCLSCTNTTICTGCISPTYLQGGGGVCELCSAFISNCQNCTLHITCNTSCTGCLPSYGLVNGSSCSSTCELCSNIIVGCENCLTPSSCTLCYNGYYLSNGTCLKCYIALNDCAVCSSSTICVLCFPDATMGPSNTTCICNTGLTSVSNLCASTGCSSAYRFNSTTVCLACNTSTYFQLSGNVCVCFLGFKLTGSTCQIICGDGRVITQQCDDNNTISGDGCSSTCTIETDYSCSQGSLYHRSVCVYVGTLTVSLVQVSRVLNANEADISLTIAPVLRTLMNMNFNNYLSLTVGGVAMNCSTSYSDDGSISVLVSYNTNIESEAAVLSLAYDSTLVGLPASVLKFNMVSYNQPLNVVSASSGLDNIILYVGYAVTGLFLLQMFLSIAFNKMIGLETMQVLQVVFFVRFLLGDSGSMAIYNMYSLGYINGYDVFSQYTNVMNLDGVLMRMGFGKNFVFNVMIQVGVIIIANVFSFYFGNKVTDLRARGAEQTTVGIQELKKAITLETKFKNCVFIISVYSFYLFVFGLISSVQTQNQVNYQLPRLMFIFTLIVFFYAGLYMTTQMYQSWQGKYDEDEGYLYKYVTFFLSYDVLMVLLIIGLDGVSFALEVIGVVQIMYIVILLVLRPYYVNVQNVLLIVTQFVGLGFTLLLIGSQYFSIGDVVMSYAIIGYEGLLVVVGILPFVRMYIHVKGNGKAFKLLHEEDDRLKGKDIFNKADFNKHKEDLQHQKEKPTILQKKKRVEQMNMDQLTKLKMRLKSEYKQRRDKESNLNQE